MFGNMILILIFGHSDALWEGHAAPFMKTLIGGVTAFSGQKLDSSFKNTPPI